MRTIIALAALLLGTSVAQATMFPRCPDCDAILRGCLSRAWWQVDVDHCHAKAENCKWRCEPNLRRDHVRPDPWAATVKRG
jgi:hypothetical protein